MEQLGVKLRSLRKRKQLSLKQLAERVGCSPSYLSMVENGRLDPGVSRLKRIADGLGITIVDLFQTSTGTSLVIRSHDRICAEFPSSRTRIEILVPQIPEKQIDARMAIIHPGGSSSGEYRHPGEEFGYVMRGVFELTVDGVEYSLQEGDSFYFASTSNHHFRNPGKEDTLVLWVNHPPSW
ncbi:MAG: cupin domain-containing protein [Desulfobacteraceae bacterium]|nr:MAG: cupin domain-containing protein [Desulfobacteraceae bacterium]